MKRLVALVLCLLPSLALAIPPYPTVWYREQTVRNTADIRALEESTVARESAAEASEGLAGTLRYRVAGDASYLEAVMQTGAETWEWVVLKTNSWAE
jgi:hypothetical protein